MGKTGDLFKKMRDTKGTFHAKITTIKDRNGMDLIEAEDIKKRWQKYTESESESEVAQSCPTLCNPIDYIVHGILQARILELVAFPFSRGSSQPRIEPRSPALQADSLSAEPQGNSTQKNYTKKIFMTWITSVL